MGKMGYNVCMYLIRKGQKPRLIITCLGCGRLTTTSRTVAICDVCDENAEKGRKDFERTFGIEPRRREKTSA